MSYDGLRVPSSWRFSLVLLIFFAALASGQSCFWPDRTVANGFQRCNTSSAQCCFNTDPTHQDLCFDNGLCQSQLWGGIYRGACSDLYWNPTSGCAPQCLDVYQNTTSPVTPCGQKMCCGGPGEAVDCCKSSKLGFFWGNSTATNVVPPPCAPPGLATADKIAITGVAVSFGTLALAVIAWLLPQSPESKAGRVRQKLVDWTTCCCRRRRKNASGSFGRVDSHVPLVYKASTRPGSVMEAEIVAEVN